MRQSLLNKDTEQLQSCVRSQLNPHSILVAIHYSCINNSVETLHKVIKKKESLFDTIPLKARQIITAFSLKTNTHDFSELDTLLIDDATKSLGYSCSGQIIAVGQKVTLFRAGDYVACAGGSFDTYSDIVCIPETSATLIDPAFTKQTSSAALASVALHALHRAHITLGETVCIIGLGLIGQLSVQLAKLAGCQVIGIDLKKERTDLAKKLGADAVFLGDSPTLDTDVTSYLNNKGADCTLITASSTQNDIIQHAMNITRKKGSVVIVGDIGLSLEREPFYKKEINLLTSSIFGSPTEKNSFQSVEQNTLRKAVRFIQNKQLDLDTLLFEEFSIENIESAYKSLKENNKLGAFIKSNQTIKNNSFIPALKTTNLPTFSKFIPALCDDVHIGIIGINDLTRNKLSALTSLDQKIIIDAVTDYNIGKATKIAQFIGAKKTYLNEQELFNTQSINALIIASPYRLHQEHTLHALQAGKAVFVERPLATSLEHYAGLKEYLDKNPTAPLCVDYSRSFAPFIQKIKWEVVERNSPLVMHYRINAPLNTGDSIINSQKGLGKIIEEACSIFDIFCFLTASDPVSLSVESLKPHNDTVFPTDNFSISISFKDGSIGSLLYTSLGNNQNFDTERFELFFDQKSIEMKDFKTLRGFGTSRLFDETTSTPNNGYQTLINQFFSALKTKECIMPIPLNRLKQVANLTLLTDKLVCEGGGTREV